MHIRIGLSLLCACAAAPLSSQPAPAPAKAEAAEAFDPKQGAEAVTKLASALEKNFVFPEVGRAYAAMLRKQLAAGAYAQFPNKKAFADKVTDDLQAVHKDGHLRLHVVPASARGGPGGEGRRMGPSDSSTITRSGWLADGVAYIDFTMFPGNAATMKDLATFLAKHKDARTLIIDARQHRGGGLAEMDAIFPQIFARPTVLVHMDTREAVDRREGNPLEGQSSLRTVKAPAGVVRREHFVTPAKEQGGLATAKVYLLTSGRTASAAEHLALALKRTGRATLVGETTRGAGHYGAMLPMDEGFTYAAFIPVGRTFDPYTNEGWEGVGVKPDVAVPADKALDEALKLAGVATNAAAALAALR